MKVGNIKSKSASEMAKIKRKEKNVIFISENHLLETWTNGRKSQFDRQKMN